MGTNIHQKHLAASGRQHPPSGRNDDTADSHALRAGKKGPTQRKSEVHKEPKTRAVGGGRTGSDKH